MSRLTHLRPADRHRVVSAGFTGHVAAVRDWEVSTPVGDWVARDVVGHLVGWFTEFLNAGGLELPPGPDVQTDPAAAWQAHVERVQALLDGANAEAEFRHPMVGTHRLADAVDRFYTPDVFMHTWDLATANGQAPEMDPDFAAQLLDGMSGIEDLLRSSGQYGPALTVAADADPVTRLAAFIGRDPGWMSRSC
ncbi:TIGR03086 family protein [Mycolicibacterium hodleri]|uniref:TIGR03086 family protein n=1 Tax=Mycolicibacterium hodleri TaxID=49897 RepID=A0A502EER7_9MYCO|nr:TIGR03086 family protein [Mycolicibacterium hodleri]TPG34970.1 TIGR03086 family protein [Mycolicibacterium hodleri]